MAKPNTATMRVVMREDHGRELVRLTCTREHPGSHDTHRPGCEWREQFGLYMTAAIGEGHCPWGHGRLGDGGACRPCLGTWSLIRNGDGWAWNRFEPCGLHGR